MFPLIPIIASFALKGMGNLANRQAQAPLPPPGPLSNAPQPPQPQPPKQGSGGLLPSIMSMIPKGA